MLLRKRKFCAEAMLFSGNGFASGANGAQDQSHRLQLVVRRFSNNLLESLEKPLIKR